MFRKLSVKKNSKVNKNKQNSKKNFHEKIPLKKNKKKISKKYFPHRYGQTS